jgi:hypothetical protein
MRAWSHLRTERRSLGPEQLLGHRVWAGLPATCRCAGPLLASRLRGKCVWTRLDAPSINQFVLSSSLSATGPAMRATCELPSEAARTVALHGGKENVV